MSWKQQIPGKNADLLLLHTDTPNAKTLVEPNIFKFGGVAVAGIEKLAARVAIRLMTPVGGQLYDDIEGAQLMTDAIAGRLRRIVQVTTAFAIARETILDQFAQDVRLYPNTPSDERLASLSLSAAKISGDEVYLQVEITSAANGVFTLIQPITVS